MENNDNLNSQPNTNSPLIQDFPIIQNTNPIISNSPAPKSNMFKYLFYVFFASFLISISYITYINLENNDLKKALKSQNNNNIAPTLIPTDNLTPTPEVKVEDITKDWQLYTDPTLGFSFKYPKEIKLMTEEELSKKNEEKYAFIEVQISKITELDESIENGTANAMSKKSYLDKGLLFATKNQGDKILKINNTTYGQLSTLFKENDDCNNIILSRSFIFYSGEYQVNLFSAYRLGASLIPTRFISINKEKCGEIENWKNVDTFYKTISTNNLENKELQNWFNNFEELSKSIKL